MRSVAGPALACLALLLAGCESEKALETPPDPTGAGAALEKSAIARGVIPDPARIDLEGRYERRSDLGTDKFCAVHSGDRNYRFGIFAAFGPGSHCEGQGEARRDGDGFLLTFDRAGDSSGSSASISADRCELRAAYDGVELRIDGDVPEACSAVCDSRASLAGTNYFMVEPGRAAARQTLGDDIEHLCG